MFQWLKDNSQVLTLFAQCCTLGVWVLYAQLLLNNYKRQRQPRLIINRGAGKGVGALCLLSNMSAEPVFINQLTVILKTNRETLYTDVTDIRESGQDDVDPDLVLGQATHQGPLNTGDFTHIGTFQGLIRRAAEYNGLTLENHRPPEGWVFEGLEIRAVAFYGSDHDPIGVRRRFRLGQHDGHYCALIAEDWQTQQLTTRRQRRMVQDEWMVELEPKAQPKNQ
ncbi:hypothetical protein [Pseudomonas sp. AS2.8]|uniref:hypothetical protein n=1 Tax=Pseudomonas sp. AS2.8 TaxID=2587128 RepID=UPI00161AB20D|nr:hypothetical protein [Pseudomonas sp. AS2.8]MBB2897549.1 hypothetical protein [Pseudomonas sp. AS2.8]